LLYTVHVEFRNDFVTVNGSEITTDISSRPIGGAANNEIIKKLVKHFGISTANITIKSGHRSRTKIIDVIL